MIPFIASLLNSKYRNYIIVIIALLVMGVWAAYWVSGERAEAVAEYKQAVTEATTKQVKEDAETVKEIFEDTTTGMLDRADEWVQSVKTSGSDRLQRTEGSAGTAESSGGGERIVDLRGQAVLSDSELDAIREYSDLLQ